MVDLTQVEDLASTITVAGQYWTPRQIMTGHQFRLQLFIPLRAYVYAIRDIDTQEGFACLVVIEGECSRGGRERQENKG